MSMIETWKSDGSGDGIGTPSPAMCLCTISSGLRMSYQGSFFRVAADTIPPSSSCSGAAYRYVAPSRAAACVCSVTCEMPKSHSFARPHPNKTTFCGLMSKCSAGGCSEWRYARPLTMIREHVLHRNSFVGVQEDSLVHGPPHSSKKWANLLA